MYLSGILVKLHDVQFLPIVCVTLEPFTEYSSYFDSDGALQPNSTHILKANTANSNISDSLRMKGEEVGTYLG
jgi:hypothetical protein